MTGFQVLGSRTTQSLVVALSMLTIIIAFNFSYTWRFPIIATPFQRNHSAILLTLRDVGKSEEREKLPRIQIIPATGKNNVGPRINILGAFAKPRHEPTPAPSVSETAKQNDTVVAPASRFPTVNPEEYAPWLPSDYFKIQDAAYKKARSKMLETLQNGNVSTDPVPGIKKTGIVIGFGLQHVQVAFETLLAALDAKEVFKDKPLAEIIAIHADIGQCLKDVVKAVLPDLILVSTNWTSYGDEYFLKLEVFSNPIFRRYQSVVYLDVDRYVRPVSVAKIGLAKGLHRTNDTLFIAIRTQMVRGNFFVRFFNPVQQKLYLDRGYEKYLSVQSNTFELRPEKLIPPEEMTARIHELLSTFDKRVVNKNDQAFIPYLVSPDEISDVYDGFPFETKHVFSYWMKDIFGHTQNHNCVSRNHCAIRKHFSAKIKRALNIYLDHTQDNASSCVNNVRTVLDCHEKALRLLKQCEVEKWVGVEALFAHSMHSRCIQLFSRVPMTSYEEEERKVRQRVDEYWSQNEKNK